MAKMDFGLPVVYPDFVIAMSPGQNNSAGTWTWQNPTDPDIFLPQCPRSLYNASLLSCKRNTAPNSQKTARIAGYQQECVVGIHSFQDPGIFNNINQSSTPIIRNHVNMMGPKNRPTKLVPNCWITKRIVMMAITIGSVGISGLYIRKPSMAEETEIGGVIIPSASKAAPPIIAGQTNHRAFCPAH